MFKECDAHGKFSALVEKDASFVSAFYREGTLGLNKSIIVHSFNECNMDCSWCYYPMGKERILMPHEVDRVLGIYRGYSILMSGGEPTIDPNFFNKVQHYSDMGWTTAAITNMVKLADESFIDKAMESALNQNGYLNFACSFQHPKNQSKEITEAKLMALHNLEVRRVKPSCVMFSIQSLDELDFIADFYDRTRGLYPMIRIRTMFRNWAASGIKKEVHLSDLYKAVMHKFEKHMPMQSLKHEHSNMYCLYMGMNDGTQLSLSCAPDVNDIDLNQCGRPVYMLARDMKCYPVPIAQIVNEGIDRGWKDGFKLDGGTV